MLLSAFKEYIKKNDLFQQKDNLLLGVSGGVDSVVLCALCKQAGYEFSIAHANFNLRGPESERDAEFVAKLSSNYGTPFYSKSFETAKGAEENHTSIQVEARNLRYRWFEEIRATLPQPAWILTAHHLDDNIETMLMNFFKGTGVAGLRGILPKQNKTVRPLLFAKKEEIIQFAKENNLDWVEDSSNQSDKYSRNYFRNQVIPLIEKIYPAALSNLADNLDRFRDIESIYSAWTQKQIEKLIEKKGEELHIPILKLKKSTSPRTLLYEILEKFGFTPAQTDEAMNLLESESGKYIQSATHRLLKNRNWLIISSKESKEQQHVVIESSDKKVDFALGEIVLEKLNGETPKESIKISTDNSVAMLDASKIEFPLILRQWRPGDYFYPLGMQKKKKLARFFIDQKLSMTDKEKVWVVESNKKILWVVGLRIDNRYKVTDRTKGLLKLTSLLRGKIS